MTLEEVTRGDAIARPAEQWQLWRLERASQVDFSPFDHVLANVPDHRVGGVNLLDPGVSGQLVPAIHPRKASEILDPGHERVVVDNVALLVLLVRK